MGARRGRRRRGSGGHPARVAERRHRDRERRESRGRVEDGLRGFAREVAAAALELERPADAATFASEILGVCWEDRVDVPEEFAEDPELFYMGPLVAELERSGHRGARAALAAIAEVSWGDTGLEARGAAERLGQAGGAAPEWIESLAHPEIGAALVVTDEHFGDSELVVLEARDSDGETLAVGTEVDNNLGLMAVATISADSIDDLRTKLAARAEQEPTPEGRPRFESIDPAEAAIRTLNAIMLADETPGTGSSQALAEGRALALRYASATPGIGALNSEIGRYREVTPTERQAVLDEFLASPEGAGIATGADEALAVSSAIDFCCDYGDGQPLRWSPVRVRMLLEAWIPQGVASDDELLAAAPDAIEAFIRYGGRRQGMAEEPLALTLAQVGQSAPVMHAEAERERSSPTGELLEAARERGVDLSDPRQLESFIVEWNQGRHAT